MRPFFFLVFSVFLLPFNCAAKQFDLISESEGASIYYQGNDQIVKTAIDMLITDGSSVFGQSFPQTKELVSRTIIIGMPEHEPDFRELLDKQKIKYSDLIGKWEAYKLVASKLQGKNCLFVIGSDARGTAYGVLELSRQMGVSPWVWWADVVPERKSNVSIVADRKVHAPSVQYRGIFLNDEDWGLMPWSSKTFEPGPKGQIGPNTYAKIFELLLRLRANTIWPAMHECTIPFYQVPGNDEMSRQYGIVIGSSHCEPLLYNSAGEWDNDSMGRYNFFTNQEKILDVWTNRLQEVSGNNNHFFTIGMRGKHDGRMEGVRTAKDYKDALEEVIPIQRNLIAQYIHSKPEEVPQALIPYKEILEVYDLGMEVPDDVTLIWCDDNYGYMTRLSNEEEQKRKGGAGVYYHISYWGRPHDYLWLATTSPAQIYAEMKKAWDYHTRKLWVVNVGDIKPGEYLTEFFLDFAWDIESVNDKNILQHLKQWAGREFGTENAAEIAAVMDKYYHLATERKPEFMGWTQVELDKNKFHRGLSPIIDSEYNPWMFGDEIHQRLTAYREISQAADKLKRTIPEYRQDAFFQLIEYPVKASAGINEKILYAQKARLFATHHMKVADDYTAKSQAAQNKIISLTDYYNQEMQSGKWKGMMDMAPRQLPVFGDAPVPEPVLVSNKEVVFWPENYMSPVTDYNIDVPAFIKEDNRPFFVSVFAPEEKLISISVEHLPPWLSYERLDMGIEGEVRLIFYADFSKIKRNTKVEGSCVVRVGKERIMNFTAQSYGRKAAAYEVNGVVAMHAADYSKAKGSQIIQGYGHSHQAVSLLPATEGYHDKSPMLEYKIMTTSMGEAEVRAFLIPIHPVNGGDARVAISIDGQAPKELSFKTVGRSEQWKKDVLRNQAIVSLKHQFDRPGEHIIRVYTPDKDVVIDQLTVDFNPERTYYTVPVK